MTLIWDYTSYVCSMEEETTDERICTTPRSRNRRYGKVHKSESLLLEALEKQPTNIPKGEMSKWPLAMGAAPQCMMEDVVKSYRAFYHTKQERFKMAWTKREIPDWFQVA